jgi:hypothetical protein
VEIAAMRKILQQLCSLQAAGVALVALFYVFAALTAERPAIWFVGLAPLALLGAEAMWHLLRAPARERRKWRPVAHASRAGGPAYRNLRKAA